MNRNEHIFFRPTGESFESKAEFDDAHHAFFTGALDEDFAFYLAQESMHAFWLNYKAREDKISKEKFSVRFKELVNQMLKDL